MDDRNEIVEVIDKTEIVNEEKIKSVESQRNDSLIIKLFVIVLLFATIIFGINSYSNKKVDLNDQKNTIAEQEKIIEDLEKKIDDLILLLDNDDDDVLIVETEKERMIRITRQVEKALQNSSELTTVKHKYDAVGIFSDVKKIFKKIPLKFTETKIVYVYRGEVTAGVDLNEIKIDVVAKEDNKKIIVDLPDVKIFDSDVEADSFEFPYVDVSILNPKDMKDYINIVDSLEKQKKQQMESDKEFIKSAEDNCKRVIEGFFKAAGIEYSIEFR